MASNYCVKTQGLLPMGQNNSKKYVYCKSGHSLDLQDQQNELINFPCVDDVVFLRIR